MPLYRGTAALLAAVVLGAVTVRPCLKLPSALHPNTGMPVSLHFAHGPEPKAALPHQLLLLLPLQLLQGVTGLRPPPQPPTSLVTDEVFVVFRPGPSAASVSSQVAGRAMPLSNGGLAATVPVRKGETLAEAVKRLRASPGAPMAACGCAWPSPQSRTVQALPSA